MAVASYVSDLSDINLCEVTTGFSAYGGGGAGLGAGVDFAMEGTNAVDKQVSGASGAEKGMLYTAGAAFTIGADDHFYIWIMGATPGINDTRGNRGVVGCIGDDSSNFVKFHVDGSDTLPFGGGKPYVIRFVNTSLAFTRTLVGTPGTSPDSVGGGLKVTATSKGINLGLDAMRIGTGYDITGGDGADADATFDGIASDDASTSEGVFREVDGAFLQQGKLRFGGTSNACVFTDSNKSIFLVDTIHSLTDFSEYIAEHANTIVTWNNISITALGTNNPGKISKVSGKYVLNGCTFQQFGTSAFGTGDEVLNCVYVGCDIITASAAVDFTGTRIEGFEGTIDTSPLIWNTATDTDGYLDDMTFVKGTAQTHAIELSTSAPLTITLRNIDFQGYNASNGQNNSTIHVKRTSGTVTINVVGGSGVSSVSYKTAGATVVVQATVDYELTNIEPNTEVTINDWDVNHLLISGGTSQDNVLGTAALERQGHSFRAASSGLIDRVRAQLKINGTPTDGVQARLLDKAPGIGTHVGHTVWDGTLENVVSSDSPAGSGDDLEIIAYVRSFDWQGSAADVILHHGDDDDLTSENVRFYRASSTLNLGVANGAGSWVVLTSSSIASWPDDWRWVRVVYNHTTGVASFYYSLDPGDTARASVSWTALGTDSDTATANGGSYKINIGATDSGASWTSFWAGGIAYVAYWVDGNASTGDLLAEVDWRDKNTPSTVDENTPSRSWTASAGITMWYNQPWSNEILAADLTTSYQEVEFLFQTPLDAFVSVDYGLEFRRTGATHATNNYDIEGATTSQQANASRYDYDGTSWTEDATEDLYIELMEPASENELYHVEDEDTGSTTWQHDGTVKTIEVLLMSLDEKQVAFLDAVGTDPKSVPVQQQDDLVFSNP